MVHVVLLFLIGVHVLSAQPSIVRAPAESENFPEGTWINMRFIEHLKTNKSVVQALGILRADELLVLRAVRQPALPDADDQAPVSISVQQRDSVLLFYTSRALDEGHPTDVAITTTKGLGDQRRFTAFGQTWILGIARAKNEYIALHSTIDSNAKPDVFAVIPSRNQDPNFIFQRVLNSATLSGTYLDAKGKKFTFSALQHAATPKLEFNYRIVLVPDKPYQIMEIVSNKKKPVQYAYEWVGDTLVISTIRSNGKLKTLYKLKRQR